MATIDAKHAFALHTPALITIDSPFQGVRPEEDNWIVNHAVSIFTGKSCSWNGPANKELVSLWTDEMATNARIDAVKAAQTNYGAKIINTGNYDDCLWYPSACNLGIVGTSIPGSGSTQWLLRSAAKLDHTNDFYNDFY